MIGKIFGIACLLYSVTCMSQSSFSPIKQKITSESVQIDIFHFPPAYENSHNAAIVTVHGGGWKWGDAQLTFAAAKRFSNAGLYAIAVEYRLTNESVTPVDALRDVCNTFAWIRDNATSLKINPNKVAAYGVSAGGHLATMAATTGCKNNNGSYNNGGPDLLLLWSPALDTLSDNWFQKLLPKELAPESMSPLSTITNNMPASVIIQGALDTLTPTPATKKYCRLLTHQNSECQLVIFDGVGHLLTRNLENQESDFDPDPKLEKQADQILIEFLKQQSFID